MKLSRSIRWQNDRGSWLFTSSRALCLTNCVSEVVPVLS